MPRRQHDMVRSDMLAARQHHAAHLPALVDIEVGHATPKAIRAAQSLDRLPQALDHRHQPEGADMRMRFGENVFRRACFSRTRQHLAPQMPRILDLAVELAVAERARAAFAELHVRFRIEHRFAPQPPGILGALAHHLAALQDDRPVSRLRQDQALRTTRTAPRRSRPAEGRTRMAPVPRRDIPW